MLQNVVQVGSAGVGGGLSTYRNLFMLRPDQSPACMDVEMGPGGGVGKRLGTTTINTTVLTSNSASQFAVDSDGTLSVNLEAFWKLNEPSGTRLDSLDARDLTPVGVIGFNTGRLGDAAQFVAANSLLLYAVNHSALTVGTGDFSVSSWVYLDSAPPDAGYFVAGKYPPAPNVAQREWRLIVLSGNVVQFLITDGAGNIGVTHATTLNLSTWYHLAARWLDATKTVGLFINSNNVTFLGATTALGALGVAAGTASVTFGATTDGSAGGTGFFDGRIDETGYWKKNLTNQHVQDLWGGGTANTFNVNVTQSGWGMFDFGATNLRWLIAAAGTGIFASSGRGVGFVAIATDRTADYQEFDRAGPFLVAVSNSMNNVLYWAGSGGTSMLRLAAGSAPAVKHVLGDFQGWTFLMNKATGKRTIHYADVNTITTDPWTKTLSLPSSADDEITGGAILGSRAYICTKQKVFRVSALGGNPDFGYKEVAYWGAVPRTIQRVTFPQLGEVIICLGWDKKLRLFDGQEAQVISDGIEQENGMSPVSLNDLSVDNLHKCHAIVDTLRQVYKLYVVMQGSSETTHCFNLDLRSGAFYPWANQGFNAAVMAESGNSSILTGTTRDGFVHWINTTNTDQGTPIREFYDSSFYYERSPQAVVKGRNVALYFSPTSSGTLQYQDRAGWAASFGPSREQIVLEDTSSKVLIQKEIDVPVTSNTYQFRLSSSGSTADPWFLERADFLASRQGIGRA